MTFEGIYAGRRVSPSGNVSLLPPANKASRPLFHYTSAAGLLGIIQSKCLWATHSEFLNDSTECQLFKEILAPQLTAEFRALATPMTRMHLDRKAPEQMVDVVFNTILKTIERTSPFYFTSFCLHPFNTKEFEHGLLSQWRGYANGGFAIEFDEHEIDELTQLENQKFSHAGIVTDEVSYKDHGKRVDLKRFEGMADATLRSIVSDRPALSEGLGKRRLEDFMVPFFQVVPFLKNDGFSEEREYRSATLCIRPGHRPDIDRRVIRDVYFRVSPRGGVVPYVKLFDQLEKGLSIKSVIIGPHQNQENQRKALSLLLEQNKVKAEIRISNIPLREC